MPTARLGLATCAVRGKVYAIGGYVRANAPGLRTVEEYDPATDRWTRRADMPAGRRWLTASAVGGRCYAIGGHSGFAQPGTVTVQEYDPATDSWRSRADMPTGRVGHAAAVVHGKIFVIGGGTRPGSPVTTVHVYDPVADTWTTSSDMPTARGFFLTASTVNGKIYVIGGDGDGAAVEEYDPATDSWTTRASMPTARDTLTSAVLSGKIHAIAGKSPPDDTPLATVEEFDPVQDSWVTGTSLAEVRWGLASSALAGKIYALGGSRTSPPPHPGINANEEFSAAGVVRRCFFDAETLAPVLDVSVSARNGSELLLAGNDCSDEVPFDFLTLDAPGYRTRESHAKNGKRAKRRASLPGENGVYFGLFAENSRFTALLDSGRTLGKRKRRGFLQGLPYMKVEIVRPSDFPMPAPEVKSAAKTELRKRGRFKKPSYILGDSITRENQILLRHAPGDEPSVDCTMLEDGVCWGPIVLFDALADDRRTALERGLRRIFYHGKVLVSDTSDVKSFYRGFQATVVGQRLQGRKEVDPTPEPDS